MKKTNEPKARAYFWFLEPLDFETNQVFRRRLPAGNSCEEMKTILGKKNLWFCSRDFVTLCENSKNSMSLKFNIFVKEGVNGVIRPWAFPKSQIAEGSTERLIELKGLIDEKFPAPRLK